MSVRWMLGLATVFALLLSCGGPPSDGGGGGGDAAMGYMTPIEAAEHLQAIENDAVAIGNGLINGVLGNLVAGLPNLYVADESLPLLDLAPTFGLAPRMQLPGEASWRLAVGTWAFDETTGTWGYQAGPSDALRVRWRAQTEAATQNDLLVTWTSTTTITLPGGSTVSAPTTATLVVHEGSRKVVDLSLTQEWRATACGAHEAQRLAVAGTAGDGAAGVTFRDLSLASPSDGTWALTGGVDLRSGSLTVAVDFDTTMTGALSRDPDTCAFVGLDVEGFDIGFAVVSPVREARLAGKVDLGNVTGGVQIQVSAGRFTVGNRRVDFGGVVPPGASDPTATIAVTFAEGEVLTLRQFLDTFGLLD